MEEDKTRPVVVITVTQYDVDDPKFEYLAERYEYMELHPSTPVIILFCNVVESGRSWIIDVFKPFKPYIVDYHDFYSEKAFTILDMIGSFGTQEKRCEECGHDGDAHNKLGECFELADGTEYTLCRCNNYFAVEDD